MSSERDNRVSKTEKPPGSMAAVSLSTNLGKPERQIALNFQMTAIASVLLLFSQPG